MDKPLLTDKEVKTIKSMAIYWHEVKNRSDKTPLDFEMQQLFGMLRNRILFIVADYVDKL